jgi:hypothetical protein
MANLPTAVIKTSHLFPHQKFLRESHRGLRPVCDPDHKRLPMSRRAVNQKEHKSLSV